MYGIFTYIGIILNYINGINVGKYSSTMDPTWDHLHSNSQIKLNQNNIPTPFIWVWVKIRYPKIMDGEY